MPDVKEKLAGLLLNFHLDTNNHICDGCGQRPASEACVQIADHLIANGVTIQKWISVEERLPEDDLPVMAVVSGKPQNNITLDGAYEFATYSREEGWIIEAWPEWEGADVTHWMPLPEPPKGE